MTLAKSFQTQNNLLIVSAYNIKIFGSCCNYFYHWQLFVLQQYVISQHKLCYQALLHIMYQNALSQSKSSANILTILKTNLYQI
jgi:hypothetical protein